MAWYQKVSAFLVKFKDILTTIAGFIPLAYGIIDTFNSWAAGGDANIGALVGALAIFVVGWFTGKK